MRTRRAFFLNHLAQTSPSPPMLDFSSAKGSFIFDHKGKKFLDFISGISVSNLGHGHKKIIQAIETQAKKHLHLMVYGEHIISPQVSLAKKLTALLPKSLNSVYFLNSGSEAIEGALKLAKRYTGKHKIIAFNKAYHGSSHGALSLMSESYYNEKYGPLLPEVYFAEPNKTKDLNLIDEKTACVILEPVQAEAGVRLFKSSFLKALKAQCKRVGALLIFDEIQTGIGRTGSMFCFEKLNTTPDVLCLGKALGGGMPLSAFISSKKIISSLSDNPILGHITTFGGHPVSCAAAEASLNILSTQKNIITQVHKKEQYIKKFFKNVKGVKKIRSSGLLMALELKNEKAVFKVVDRCLENGLLVDWFLYNQNCIRIAPPLTIKTKELTWGCETLKKAISK